MPDSTGVGADTIVAGGGADRITVLGGADTVASGAGNDTLVIDYSAFVTNVTGGVTGGNLATGYTGSLSDQTVHSIDFNTAENFIITTGGGHDSITTGDGADRLKGGRGNDRLDAGGGDDVLLGQGGKDVLIGRGGSDTLNGGGGMDTADYSRAGRGADVDLLAGVAVDDGDGASDILVEIENLIGSAFNDVLAGDNEANNLNGGAGRDVLRGHGGDDILVGGRGDDTLHGGGGDNDVALMSGLRSDYAVTAQAGGKYRITDAVANRDGSDVLATLEWVRFSDGTTVRVADLLTQSTAGGDDAFLVGKTDLSGPLVLPGAEFDPYGFGADDAAGFLPEGGSRMASLADPVGPGWSPMDDDVFLGRADHDAWQ